MNKIRVNQDRQHFHSVISNSAQEKIPLFGQRPQRANVLQDTRVNFLTSIHTSVRPSVKKSQNQVKILGFYCPSCTRQILTPGIRICSQKWSQVNISIDYGYISQVKILYKVKFSKLEICQSDCRFKILGKNYDKKVSFFF